MQSAVTYYLPALMVPLVLMMTTMVLLL